MSKIAVILFNLGGPSSLAKVEEFLFNLFFDREIINLPLPIRYVIAKIISKSRKNKAIEIYKKLGGSSPIYEETLAQKKKLAEKLGADYDVYIAMRHAAPRCEDVIKSLSKGSYEQVILLPLYPQYSTTTTRSSVNEFFDKFKLKIPVKVVCCYPFNKNLIKAHLKLIKEKYLEAKEFGQPRILFSAHGLPEKIINKGDPYQSQVEQTVEAIVKDINISNLDYKITYQSRVGPVKWIEPYTDVEIKLAAKENKPLIVVPISFVSEHSETLVELDIEYKELANENGLDHYFRVKTLGIDDLFIEALAEICRDFREVEGSGFIASDQKKRVCESKFNNCLCNL